MGRIICLFTVFAMVSTAWAGAASGGLPEEGTLLVVGREGFYLLAWTPLVVPEGSVLYRVTMSGPAGEKVVEVTQTLHVEGSGLYSNFSVEALVGGELRGMRCTVWVNPDAAEVNDKVELHGSCHDPSPAPTP